MENIIADPHVGIGRQARAVLALLDRAPDFAEYKDGFYQVEIQSRAWYNGRERGVSLCVSRMCCEGCLVITFGEHRNSDSIFVDSWLMKQPPFNSPTTEDFSDEAYKARKSFPYGHAGDAADYIYEKMAEFYATLVKADSKTPKWVEAISGEA